jgi:hypothetical protein
VWTEEDWKRYRIEHREQHKLYMKQYYVKHRQEYTEYRKQYRFSIRDTLIQLLGGRCVACGSNKKLEIDHINGGGRAERRLKFGNDIHELYRYYVGHPEDAMLKLQILCELHNKEKKKVRKEFGKKYVTLMLHTHHHNNCQYCYSSYK